MFSFKFAFRNVRSRKSSIVIILFIAFAISLLVVSNSVFDGTDSGMEATFVNSFTGDIVIRPKSEFPLSLFGDETPITGELSEIPPLIPYTDVMSFVSKQKGICFAMPQVTGMAAMNINDDNWETFLFGVNADKYVECMSGIELLEGHAFTEGERGIMLNEVTFKNLNADLEEPLCVGDTIKLVMANGVSFSIRAVPLTCVYRYKVKNSRLENIALIDPETLRGLMGIQNSFNDELIDDSQKNLIEDSSVDFFDDLFSDVQDTVGQEADVIDVGEQLQRGDIIFNSNAQSNSWSFIICKTDNSISSNKIIKNLNKEFKKNGWPVQAIKWRTAAGGSVVYVFYLRVILNIGIILVLLTGFIVINNTLIISSLARVCETGTLRAVGATRNFIALQFLFETSILAFSAYAIGLLLGVSFSYLVNEANIHLVNTLFVQLFGGEYIRTVLTSSNILRCFILSVIIAIAGWLYPVRVALGVNPIEAMRGQI